MADAGPRLEILLLADCARGEATPAPPPSLDAGNGALPRLHIACYRPIADVVGNATVEVTAILNNFDKFGVLLSAMLATMPNKAWYLKLDTDAVVVPANLLRFLSFFSMNAAAPTNLYFGDAGELPQRSNAPEDWAMYRIHGRSKDDLFKRPGWKALVDEYFERKEKPNSEKATVAYVQGGLEGFSGDALGALVSRNCVARVGAIPCDRSRKKHCINKPEDATVGLCAHLHKIALVDCQPCFQNIISSPTPVAWVRDELAKAGTPDARFCRRPISVHAVKDPEDQTKVYALLRAYTRKLHRPPGRR